jgi:hypothetical protein
MSLKYIFISSVHGLFRKFDHMLDMYQAINILELLKSCSMGMITLKFLNIRNISLNNPCVKKKYREKLDNVWTE